MNISIKYGTKHIDWVALCEIIRLAPLGTVTREPEKLKIADVQFQIVNITRLSMI